MMALVTELFKDILRLVQSMIRGNKIGKQYNLHFRSYTKILAVHNLENNEEKTLIN